MLEINSKAPDFSLPDENGTIHKLSDYSDILFTCKNATLS